MIDRDNALSITRQAKLLGISPGSVYYMRGVFRGGQLPDHDRFNVFA